MKKKNAFVLLIELFVTFFKIGLLTFGGGYAMIPIIQKEVVEKRKWMNGNDILDILAISESTPGPIAVNSATYVGFKVMGFWGSLVATLGLAIPSFTIIFVVSLFYEKFLSWGIVNAIFKGLKVGVIILLVMAVIKLKKSVEVNTLGLILFTITLAGMLLLTFFNIKIQSVSILFIIMGMLVGIIATALSKKEGKK
ncbi:MAG: chromate transporter [Bacilli bacterium]|nr:chromate transporter [Bacilli bacterium]